MIEPPYTCDTIVEYGTTSQKMHIGHKWVKVLYPQRNGVLMLELLWVHLWPPSVPVTHYPHVTGYHLMGEWYLEDINNKIRYQKIMSSG